MPVKNFEKANQIRSLKAMGLDQKAIAEVLGCSQTNISHMSKTHVIEWDIGYASPFRNQWGENNPSYINGLGRSTIERLTRRIVLNSGRSLFTCERCGKVSKDQEQQRHHKDRDRSNNASENIEVLCPTCHMKHHNELRTRNENGQYLD